jgi:hypothetical protein
MREHRAKGGGGKERQLDAERDLREKPVVIIRLDRNAELAHGGPVEKPRVVSPVKAEYVS